VVDHRALNARVFVGIRAGQSPIEIRVDESSTTALLYISENQDTITLEQEAVLTLVRDKRVEVTAEVERRVAEIIADFKDHPRRLEEVILQATPPQHGKDAYFEWSPDMDPTAPRKMQPKPQDGSPVDFYNLSSMIRVRQGDVVAKFHEAQAGANGRDIYGRVAEARNGKECEVTIDPSLTKRPDGSIVANIGGSLECKGNVLRVSRMLEIEGYVDFSTGNIKFDGSIKVRDGVRDRFEITATEDVIVEGLIEAATISAGKNLLSRRGMAARHRGQIRIDGNAEAGFLNNVRGYVRGDLTIRREIMNCDLAVGGQLVCQDAVVLGGTLAVMKRARVGILGSEGGTTTTIVLGAAPLLTAQIREVNARIEKFRKALEHRGGAQALALAGKKVQPGSAMAAIVTEIEQIKSRIAEAESTREQLHQRILSERAIELHVTKMLFAKVCLRAFDTLIIVGEPIKGPLVVMWDPTNGLHYRQGGNGPAKPIPAIPPKPSA
jgi:hypothetical protein